MAEKEDIKNLEKSNKSDFSQLNATLKQNNDAEDKRDKRRLDQATAHSQKSEKNLQALKGVVTSTESESTTKELKSDKQTRSDAGKQHKKRNSADIKKDKTEKAQTRGQKIIAKIKGIKDGKNFKNLGNFIGKGLLNLGKNIGGKMAFGAKAIGTGIAALALFAFLQSDTFKNAVSYLVDFITDFIDLVMNPSFSSAGDMLTKHWPALTALFLYIGLKLASIITGTSVIKLALTGMKIAMLALGSGLGGLLSGLATLLIPLAIPIAIVAAIALVAYGIVQIFRGFQEYFGEANEQFGFFGGILAGFTGGLKNIFAGVVGVIDSIFGFFGFPDLMDPIIKAIEEFDVMNFVGGIVDFFSNLGNIIMESLSSFGKLFKAIGAGAIAAIKSPFSPIESFNKAFGEVMAGGSEGSESKPNLGNIAKAGAGMSGGEADPARFVARKENEDMQMKRKEEMMGDKRAVTIVKNTVSKGGDNYSEVRGGEIHVHDHSANAFTTAN